MQRIKHFTRFYHTVLFFCSKRCKIKFDTLFDYENQHKRELQHIATNHSADYKDFVKIYRECTKEPFSFLTIDTTVSLLRFRKNLFSSYKNDSNRST